MPNPSVLACPASLKGVLSAREAASALADGLRTWAHVDELPIADGGEGTLDVLHAALGGEWRDAQVHDAFGRPRTARWLWHDGVAFIEAAEAIPLDPERLDPLEASSRGLGELVEAVGNLAILFVALGGTATVDGGSGMRSVVRRLPAAATLVLCDVDVALVDAARLFARQKGATPDDLRLLEERLLALDDLRPFADVRGAGAAGGLGAAFAALGARLEPGAAMVLTLIHFDPLRYDLVVTGEGTVDATTFRGKAPGEVVRRCQAERKRCVLFGGRVVEAPSGVEVVALSGDPGRARDDLRKLGEQLRAS
jgi:glycerate kinase